MILLPPSVTYLFHLIIGDIRDMTSHRVARFAVFLGLLILVAAGRATAQDGTSSVPPGPVSSGPVPSEPVPVESPSPSPSQRWNKNGGAPPAYFAGFTLTPWQVEVGYQYNALNIRGAFPTFSTSGVNGSVTRFLDRGFGIEGEVGLGLGTAAPGMTAWALFAGGGPRFALRTRKRYEPWVHGLIGFEHLGFQSLPAPFGSNALAWMAGGGVDYRFGSGWAVRGQADYLGTDFGGAFQRNLQIVGGLVWNF
jgi:hypothetical protein